MAHWTPLILSVHSFGKSSLEHPSEGNDPPVHLGHRPTHRGGELALKIRLFLGLGKLTLQEPDLPLAECRFLDLASEASETALEARPAPAAASMAHHGAQDALLA